MTSYELGPEQLEDLFDTSKASTPVYGQAPAVAKPSTVEEEVAAVVATEQAIYSRNPSAALADLGKISEADLDAWLDGMTPVVVGDSQTEAVRVTYQAPRGSIETADVYADPFRTSSDVSLSSAAKTIYNAPREAVMVGEAHDPFTTEDNVPASRVVDAMYQRANRFDDGITISRTLFDIMSPDYKPHDPTSARAMETPSQPIFSASERETLSDAFALDMKGLQAYERSTKGPQN